MDLQQLDAFLAVADELHFGRAAERLTLSRSRVSRLIASLEREVGGALFERTSRRVRLTPLGCRFSDQVRPACAQLRGALDDVRTRAREVTGVLRVGFTLTTGGEALTRLVAAFQAAYPGCEVTLREIGIGDPYGPLRTGQIDVLVNWLTGGEPDLAAGPAIDSRPRVLAVARHHPLASRPSVSAEVLADLEMTWVPPFLPPSYDAIVPSLTPSGRPTRRTYHTESFHQLLALVASGHIVHPTLANVPVMRRADIALVPISDLPPLSLGLVWCVSHENARIRAFAEIAAASAGAGRESGSGRGAGAATSHGWIPG